MDRGVYFQLAFERLRNISATATCPDEVRKAGFDPSGAIEFWDVTSRQDWELSDLAQEGISSRGYRPGPYSNREDLLFGLDRFVLYRLQGAEALTSQDCG